MADHRRKMVPDGDRCICCGKEVYSSDEFEFSKTRRGHLLFVHRECWLRMLEAGAFNA
jgi:hypothetical protein